MGADIRIAVEVRGPDGWKLFDEPVFPTTKQEREQGLPDAVEAPFTWRNYAVFNVLAGVRDFGFETMRPVVAPRGLPDDVDPATLAELDYDTWMRELNAHSVSWVTAAELQAYPTYERQAGRVQFGGDPGLARPVTVRAQPGPADVRIVFFFDN